MQYRRLGNSGLKVSAIGLGGNTFGRQCDEALSARIIGRALDLGVTFLDTADIYAQGTSERYVGHALRGRRYQVVLATKMWGRMGEDPNDQGLSQVHIMAAIEDSLRRLGTDHVDLYQCHVVDDGTPIEETLRALDDLIHQGKVRYVGCSNFPAWHVCEALWASDRRHVASFVSVQQQYNVLDRGVERELIPLCRAHGLGLIPYHPLAGGLLTGKYRAGEPPAPDTRFAVYPQLQRQLTDQRLAVVARLEVWAREHGHTVGDLAIAWLLAQPVVASVIAGATKVEQVEANVAASEWVLTAHEAKQIVHMMNG